jgi:hypothetical protein
MLLQVIRTKIDAVHAWNNAAQVEPSAKDAMERIGDELQQIAIKARNTLAAMLGPDGGFYRGRLDAAKVNLKGHPVLQVAAPRSTHVFR